LDRPLSARALLVANGGGLGDALLATVVARALRDRYDAVDMLVLPSQRAIADHAPDIAETLVDDGASPPVWAGRLRARSYAASVTTWATARGAAIGVLARIPIRVGQSRRLYSPLFTQRVAVRSERGDTTTHWTQILLDYARALGCDTTDAVPRFVAADADRAEAHALRAEFGIDDDAPYALLHPTRGIAHARERWPVAPFVALAARLRERYGTRVLVSGSPADAAIAEAIAQGGGATSIAGRASLGAFAVLAGEARFVAAMDSGPLHVAAAVGAPTVGIFALRSDQPERWAPLGPHAVVVRGTYPCPPDHRKETCPNFACIAALPEGRISDAVDGLLARVAESECP
jgi:ADP-heptose:LPS heptosyltransferase